jgi:hypothetical protein
VQRKVDFMAKTNVRSFRFDDEVLKIIEGCEGDNCSDKFDRLVRHCFLAVPEAQRELEEIKKQIIVEKKNLKKITDLSVQLNSMKNNMLYLSQNMSNIVNETTKMYEKIKGN